MEKFAGEVKEASQVKQLLKPYDAWRLHVEGCLVVHVDVATNLNCFAAGMVALDGAERVVFVGSTTFEAIEAELAEKNALLWTFNQAVKEECNGIMMLKWL